MTRWLLAPLLAVALATLAPAQPIKLIPKTATLVVQVENPRKLVESVTGLDLFDTYKTLPQVQQLFQSGGVREALRILGYAEKKLGAKWPELLDTLAGRGIVLGAAPEKESSPVLLVLEGKNASSVTEGFNLVLEILEEEMSRQSGQESVVKLQRGKHEGAVTVKVGDFHAAQLGTRILLSNSEPVLHAAIHRSRDKSDADSVQSLKGFQEAQVLDEPKPLAALWFNLLPSKETQASKDFFASTRKDLIQTVAAGSTIDAVRRSEFVTLSLRETPRGMKLSIRLPAKRDDLPKELSMHVPPSGSTPATLPLLEPPNVLYSQSLHLDLASMWRDRKTLFNEIVLKDIEEGVKNISRVLPGTSLDALFLQSGPYHRFVAVELKEDPYSIKPVTQLPGFAIVSSMRDREFGNGITTTLRAAGLLASLQLQLKMTEEVVDGVKITSYRFPEKTDFPGDVDRLRFNIVPCFAVAGDSLITSTSPKLLKDLLVELKKPARADDNAASVWRGKVYGSGLATALRQRPDAVITDAVLARGVALPQAKAEVAELAKFLESFGTVGFSMNHGEKRFQFELEWTRK